MTGSKGNMAEYDRFNRSIRQIMVLEFELRGLFKAPDRDAPRKLRLVKSDRPGFVPPTFEQLMARLTDIGNFDPLDIRTDYRHGPLDEIIAGIRDTLGAEAPPGDPFAPVAKAPEPATPAPVSAPPRGPEYYMRARPAEPESKPVGPQTKPSMKAAELAIMAMGGKGFRKPSAKTRPSKHRRNRRATQIGPGRPAGFHERSAFPSNLQLQLPDLHSRDPRMRGVGACDSRRPTLKSASPLRAGQSHMAGSIGFRADFSFFVIPAHGSRQKRARGHAPAGIHFRPPCRRMDGFPPSRE